MIFDLLSNVEKYTTIPYIKDICNFIKKNKIFELPAGDIPIKGEELFVKVLRYTPNNSNDLFFETHLNYADIQIVFDGIEVMQIADLKDLEVTDEFKLAGDFVFYKGTNNISQLVVSKNKFAVFFPGEAHKPGCLYSQSDLGPVLKLVFKAFVGSGPRK
jgi:YhcH/YjgK/YiaL family protein